MSRILLWTSTCGQHEIHTALLKWLVHWPSEPKAEIRLYDCNLFKTLVLVIYTTNLYRQKFPLFIPFKDEIMVKKHQLHCMGRRQMLPVGSNFNFLGERPHGADPRPRASTWAWSPLHVDVINGWPLVPLSSSSFLPQHFKVWHRLTDLNSLFHGLVLPWPSILHQRESYGR